MLRIPEPHMDHIHTIRKQYALALSEHHADPDREDLRAAVDEVVALRARAIRMVHDEDGIDVRQLSSMFRVNKTVIRDALAGGDS